MVTWCMPGKSPNPRVYEMTVEKRRSRALSRVLLGPAFLVALVAVLIWLVPSPVEPVCGR